MPADREGYRRHLTRSVYPRVGPAGPHHRSPGTCEALQSSFHLSLDGSATGLELPSEEIGPVVVDGEAESAFGVWSHADKVEGKGKRSRKGWTSPPLST